MLLFFNLVMPKKKRQEKILAQLKRLQQLQVTPESSVVLNPETSTTTKFNIPADLKSLETKTNPSFTSASSKVLDYSYAYKDLRKTLIFVAVAVIFEIVLSRLI